MRSPACSLRGPESQCPRLSAHRVAQARAPLHTVRACAHSTPPCVIHCTHDFPSCSVLAAGKPGRGQRCLHDRGFVWQFVCGVVAAAAGAAARPRNDRHVALAAAGCCRRVLHRLWLAPPVMAALGGNSWEGLCCVVVGLRGRERAQPPLAGVRRRPACCSGAGPRGRRAGRGAGVWGGMGREAGKRVVCTAHARGGQRLWYYHAGKQKGGQSQLPGDGLGIQGAAAAAGRGHQAGPGRAAAPPPGGRAGAAGAPERVAGQDGGRAPLRRRWAGEAFSAGGARAGSGRQRRRRPAPSRAGCVWLERRRHPAWVVATRAAPVWGRRPRAGAGAAPAAGTSNSSKAPSARRSGRDSFHARRRAAGGARGSGAWRGARRGAPLCGPHPRAPPPPPGCRGLLLGPTNAAGTGGARP
jgi:hypothetical protein